MLQGYIYIYLGLYIYIYKYAYIYIYLYIYIYVFRYMTKLIWCVVWVRGPVLFIYFLYGYSVVLITFVKNIFLSGLT